MVAFTLTLFGIAFLCGLMLLRPIAGSALVKAVTSERTNAGGPGTGQSLSVIIPARNEEGSLPGLLRSLQRQSVLPSEIVVVDDQSQDATAALAQEHGATVIAAAPRPDDWLGKPWAAHCGAEAASGSKLLFLDADVQLKPDAIALLVSAYAERQQAGEHDPVISVQPFHRTHRWYERLALLFNIQVFAGAAQRAGGLKLALTGSCCYGPCILCSRTAYETIGGHGSVRACVLEDIELGNRFRDANVPVYGFSGKGSLEFRMYPDGVGSMINGFSKNLLLGVLRTNPLFFFLDVFWMCGLVAAPVLVSIYLSGGLLLAACVSALFYVLLALQVWYAGSRLGSFGAVTSLLYPLSLAAFLLVVARVALLAVTGRSVSWKGRPVSPRTRRGPRPKGTTEPRVRS